MRIVVIWILHELGLKLLKVPFDKWNIPQKQSKNENSLGKMSLSCWGYLVGQSA